MSTKINWNKYSYTEEDLREAVKTSLSVRQVVSKLKLTDNQINYKPVQRLLRLLDINITHFKGQGWLKNESNKSHWKKLNKEEIFVNNSTTSRGTIKNRLLYYNLIEYKCQDCGLIDKWNNKSIVLQLDHINGINTDNRIENLRFLCPNCHSQTDTFMGKNIKKKRDVYGKQSIKYFCIDCNEKVSRNNVKCKKCSKVGVDYTQKSNLPRKSKTIVSMPIDFVLEQLKTKSRRQLAKELGVHHSTITYQVKLYQKKQNVIKW